MWFVPPILIVMSIAQLFCFLMAGVRKRDAALNAAEANAKADALCALLRNGKPVWSPIAIDASPRFCPQCGHPRGSNPICSRCSGGKERVPAGCADGMTLVAVGGLVSTSMAEGDCFIVTELNLEHRARGDVRLQIEAMKK